MKKLWWVIVFIILGLIGGAAMAQEKWRLDKNKILTGSLVFVGGGAKGFNETLQFNYKVFQNTFPGTNSKWFDPKISWRNKYQGGNPDKGSRFFLSTSLFVFVTDQYHLNNFIHRGCILSAIVFKIGEGKKPLLHYIYDLLYYTFCYQAGFSLAYYPFTKRY